MTPKSIIERAKEQNLDLIAITDHNSMRQAPLVQELGREEGIEVIIGAEVTSKENIHILTLFENIESAELFQNFIDSVIEKSVHVPEIMGDQVVIDRDEMIVYTEQTSLSGRLNSTLYEIEQRVHALAGIIIPAHIDRPITGLLSLENRNFRSLNIDAYEVAIRSNIRDLFRNDIPMLGGSDAHSIDRVGVGAIEVAIEESSFIGLREFLQSYSKRG